MPYKTDKTAINSPFLDRRNKLLPCQREMIPYWFERGKTIGFLSKMFHVSRDLIWYILNPEKLENNRRAMKARGAKHKNRQKHIRNVLRSRKYKHKKLKKFLIHNT